MGKRRLGCFVELGDVGFPLPGRGEPCWAEGVLPMTAQSRAEEMLQ